MALTTLFSFAQRRPILSAIILTVISLLLTLNITTLRFYTKARSKAQGKKPPTVPYLFVGAYHAFTQAYVGQQRFFAQMLKEYASFSPFTVKTGLTTYVILRDIRHIEVVLAAPKELITSPPRAEALEKLYGAPKAALTVYASHDVNIKKQIDHTHFELREKHLTGPPLATLTEKYTSILSQNLNNKMFQVGSWTQIEDTWSFLQQVISRCLLETLFGSDLFRKYPSVVRDYWAFDESVDAYVPGTPRLMLSGDVARSRERLLRGIEKWLEANDGGASVTEQDADWDAVKGSKFVRERDEVFANIEGMDITARAAEILSIMHATLSPLSPSTFWSLTHILHHPNLSTHLAPLFSPSSSPYPIATLLTHPLLQSVITETARLHSAPVISRTCSAQKFLLDENWAVTQGDNILIFPHDICRDAAIWEKARPRTVEKSLNVFWPDRFIVADGNAKAGRYRNTTNTNTNTIQNGVYSTESLSPILSLLDDAAETTGLGAEFLHAMQVANLAVLMAEFEIQLCEEEEFDAVLAAVEEPEGGKRAYGTVRPGEKIGVRIRKRR